MDNEQEFNGIHVQFALDGTAVAFLCLCVVLMAFPCSPVGRAIMHNMQGGTGHCPSCRCALVPAATASSSSNVDGDDNNEDEDKEDEGNDEEGGKDKCD
ncbi:hypothetical protein CNMCM6936_002683 [Aspergillus lentulus]|nr:hypothetical protein CNMCM6069_002418 [Aspergillus lentulus]KAF4162035.1 hypothetical protein CNMCM6936_002683 [Aspergillus lentulus]KAF4170394.1 hypothetical protein CNMCM8060_005550 [Aspergillus lentulus]KAF4191724.1 hypothetical protein CNMCM8694_001397 [Aspergillus lentulus]